MSINGTRYNVGGNYSISQKLKDSILEETTGGDGEEHSDVLQERMKQRSIYDKEDEYHQRRHNLNKKRDIEQVSDQTKETTQLVKKKRKSRWDVQTYVMPEESKDAVAEMTEIDNIPNGMDLRYFKPSDKIHFQLILKEDDEEKLSTDDQKKYKYLVLLLKVKNGSTQSRRDAMKKLISKCESFGPKIIFDCTLPILLDRSLEDQERHLLIKFLDRLLFKLGSSVRPFAKDVLAVLSPLLIDEDPTVRVTGRDVISNLASVTGLVTMLQVIRPDMENEDEYVRNIAARLLAIISRPLGVNNVIPFIDAACHSRNSWRSRHTGIKSIGQMSKLLGIAQLPYLDSMMQCVSNGLDDEHIAIRMLTANTIATLAEDSFPYGIESFNIILEPLWKGLKKHRGKMLAAFIKCLASILPLMNTEYAGYYTEELMHIICREFHSPDEEMRRAILIVLQKCCKVETVTPRYLREQIGPIFFKNFWNRRVALDKNLNKMVTYTTVVLAEKMGTAYIVDELLKPLRDDSEPFRVMAIHAVDRVVQLTGTTELDNRLESRLLDALLIAFQDQKDGDPVIFRGFGTVAASLGVRMKPYLSPIVSAILNQLKHKDKIIRQNAADLCYILIPVIKECDEIEMINKLNIILYESLGEMYPDVLGSIIKVINAIMSVMDFKILQPPVNQILPSLTPILRNNHKKVQLNTVKLIGCVARKGPDYVPPKEWLRVCFELLELLKSTNKKTRIAANSTFGEIAKAVGPQDVLVVLLNNLKVQERQLRVCTAVAIGIVAKVCGPYTVLPAMMNEYKTPETNVQNGILKAMTFMFEYIGSMSQDYVYFISPLLEDALVDRDLIHRQTAATVVRNIALNCIGVGNEDVFIHLLNLLIPNVFETSPHVIVRILDGLEALNYAIGPGVFMNYIWAGLFHPAKNVRAVFWKLFNKVYVESGDTLVPHYPLLQDTENKIEIEELDWIL
ncbi:similar to Saccharomyces cerevisiae YMR288W HSH155 5 U2-snRNP associated splicing factor [Maudiozyma saulgeensis]|uniref:Similar to Saccharomyces cerevisiae YMR288W HSH155 5 U2-snRNP associated splicing factor n=1 Tax=Maudiozyma saulgeensis TaxID=1789683 RepID=A0A1X7RAS3_9SACH|nr:similar to Saccharomyces cerevisiae YMR288W HSH155 5 U2-snRNP associated splicing factor [Kazachstania saulgeensis]